MSLLLLGNQKCYYATAESVQTYADIIIFTASQSSFKAGCLLTEGGKRVLVANLQV